jgi:hypothetical protein
LNQEEEVRKVRSRMLLSIKYIGPGGLNEEEEVRKVRIRIVRDDLNQEEEVRKVRIRKLGRRS